MPWNGDRKNAGFSEADETWLPIPYEHYELSVDKQEHYKDSVLNFTRQFLKWRKKQPALTKGGIQFHDFGDNKILGFTRSDEQQTLFCAFNLSDGEKTITVPETKENVVLAPFGTFYAPPSS